MTKVEIIDELSRTNTVEKIVFKLLPCSKNPFDCPEDLIQDLYLILLQKDDDLIVNLYNKGEIGFYLLKIAKNQLLSANSPYYQKYIRFQSNSDDISEAAHIPIEDNR